MNHTTITGTVHLDHRITRAWRVFGVIVQPQSYRNAAYLLLGLPLGIGWFTVLVTAAAVATSMLVVALVGVPLLVAFWYFTRVIANIERRVADVLLGQQLSTVPMNLPSGNLWTRLRALSADPDRRRELVYLLLRLPVGVATFVAVTTCLTASAAVAYAPFYARYHDNPTFGDWSMSSHLHDVASQPWSWLLVPLGASMFVASVHILNGVAAACGRWTASSLNFAK
jgi:hypothetical protein